MSNEEKPPMPEQPKTLDLPAPSPTDIAIARLTNAVEKGFSETRADISLVSNDLSIVKDRVTVLETERSKLSGGVRQLSTADADKGTLIQELTNKVDALAAGHAQLNEKQDAQTQILVAISENAAKFVASPRVKIAGGIAFGIVAKWLADHYGIHLPQ